MNEIFINVCKVIMYILGAAALATWIYILVFIIKNLRKWK